MRVVVFFALIGVLTACGAEAKMEIPGDFPRFAVPGCEKQMESVRELYWLHYPGSGPKATMWDAWLAPPALWPAVETGGQADSMRKQWSDVLSTRIMEPDGYVSVHQHASIAHPHGWPFPFWNQGTGGMGWHFSFKDTPGPPWRQGDLNNTDGWKIGGADASGIGELGWSLKLTGAGASVETPVVKIDTLQAPFLQLRWVAEGIAGAQPSVEWTTSKSPRFGPERRVYFDAPEDQGICYSVIPMCKHPKWAGEITGLRVNFGNAKPGGSVTVHSFFTQYDTRHDITGPSYVRGCAAYFNWTRDLAFLRRNMSRMRMALRYVMTEHHALERKYVYNTWVGHDGRSGLRLGPKGKEILSGHGVGDNYWDLLPFGNKDAYATILYYDSLLRMAEVEKAILDHPEWDVARGVLALDPDELTKHAAEVKKLGNKLFWNAKNGRFINCIDADEKTHDFGYTFLNFEAIYYDFATPEHAKQIMSWLDGKRSVEGDTAQGADIYHWRFAPRATTKRNVEYYLWVWSGPETIPYGGQIQDGGAVLGWSYHDLMARIKTTGPDDAWNRLQEIVKWFDEVQAAGGYRKYYDGKREGSMQGSGTAGGLGLDQEFFESVLVPQVMIDGFLGFAPTPDGFRIDPHLPSMWPEMAIDRIRWRDLTLKIKATKDAVEISAEGTSDAPCVVRLPKGKREVDWSKTKSVRFELTPGR